MNFIQMSDVKSLFRELTIEEEEKAAALIPVVCDSLRQEAQNCGKDLDEMIATHELLPNVLKSVCADVIGRALMTSTHDEPMSQVSQSALGYSFSGTYLVAGGGLFIKKSELARLGLRKQRVRVHDLCD